MSLLVQVLSSKTLPHFEHYVSILAPLSHLLSILRLASFSELQVSQCSFEQSKLMQIKSQNLKNSFPNFEIMSSWR